LIHVKSDVGCAEQIELAAMLPIDGVGAWADNAWALRRDNAKHPRNLQGSSKWAGLFVTVSPNANAKR